MSSASSSQSASTISEPTATVLTLSRSFGTRFWECDLSEGPRHFVPNTGLESDPANFLGLWA